MSMEALDIRDRVTLSPIPLSTGTQKPARPSTSFDDLLTAALQHVDGLQKEANQSIQSLTVEGGSDIHETMIAMEKADLSFRLMLQVRSKLVDAYQEVMRIQV
jgi:flagellar hook-basal body complex protein FliE